MITLWADFELSFHACEKEEQPNWGKGFPRRKVRESEEKRDLTLDLRAEDRSEEKYDLALIFEQKTGCLAAWSAFHVGTSWRVVHAGWSARGAC